MQEKALIYLKDLVIVETIEPFLERFRRANMCFGGGGGSSSTPEPRQEVKEETKAAKEEEEAVKIENRQEALEKEVETSKHQSKQVYSMIWRCGL